MLLQKGALTKEFLDEALEGEELNLAPIMNLFVILIPFLLLSASFVNYSVIRTPSPQAGAPATSKSKSPTVTLTIGSSQLNLEVISPRGKRARHRFKADDTEKLLSRLRVIKKRYPKHETVFIKSGRGVKYSQVIGLVDTLRGEPALSESDRLELSQASAVSSPGAEGSSDKKKEKKLLFNEVVFGDVF